jgi:hypothetical protein
MSVDTLKLGDRLGIHSRLKAKYLGERFVNEQSTHRAPTCQQPAALSGLGIATARYGINSACVSGHTDSLESVGYIPGVAIIKVLGIACRPCQELDG